MTNYARVLMYSAAAFLLTAGLSVGAQNTQPPSTSNDDHPDFPPGEGRELTIKVCSTCHSVDVISSQQLDADSWKETVTQMASMGADATDEQLDQIVKYLAKAFPPPESKGDKEPPK